MIAMTGTRVIGLGGKLRAGKDAVADRLVERHGFVKIGMSDALHEAAMALNPIIGLEPLYGDYEFERYADRIAEVGYVKAKEHSEVRRVLQALGTEVGRNMIGENVWTDVTAKSIQTHLDSGRRVVVTGIRYPNELRMVGSFAGLSFWVDRPGLTQPREAATHSSETSLAWRDFDDVISNNGTLEQLHIRVDGIAV